MMMMMMMMVVVKLPTPRNAHDKRQKVNEVRCRHEKTITHGTSGNVSGFNPLKNANLLASFICFMEQRELVVLTRRGSSSKSK